MDIESNKIELSSGDLQSPPDLESFPDLGERFEVLSLIGSGGMGRVFKVLDRQADRIMAVKLLRPELSSETALAKRFQQEVQAASRLTHNNIVTVLEGATTPDGSQMMVMEFLNGETLGDFIQKNKPIDQFLAIKICLQILEALGFAHSQGVLHRDLKPSNIILSPSPSMEMPLKASVVDFGIARVISQPAETHSGITRTGEMFGSPLYMSPEQCQGEVVCESSDLYSLGCVLYEALSGHPPYSGSNSFQVMTAHVSGTIPTIERSDVLSGLRVVVDTCLQKSPGDRYRDADSLIEDLNLVLHGERLRHAQSSGQRKLASIREKLKEGVSPSCCIGAFVVCLVLVLVTVCNTIPTTRGFEPTQMPHAEAPLIVIEKPEVKRPTVSKPELPKATVFESRHLALWDNAARMPPW